MCHQMSGLSLQYPLRTISFFIVHLLSHVCTGHSQLIGSLQPIVAKVGDDVILPCHLQPAVDVAAKTIEWTRPDLDPRFVYVWRAGQELHPLKNPSYKGRTTLFTDELKHGNISLKLSKVKPSDEGRYKCYIPDMNTDSSVELVVASEAVSSPVISLAGIDKDKGGVVLQFESAGWYPEPEVFWLDGEGNLLSAGPTETVRGPDDLYTVSSRVTVEKRHSNSFTCRVQQKDINQTRETHIQVPDDFFEVQSSLSPITVGLAVCLSVCIVIILLLIFTVWKWRQNRIKIKRSHRDETDEQKIRFKSNKPEVQVDIGGEREQLTTDETVTTKDLKNRKRERETKHFKEQQRRDEAEKRVQRLKEELETKRNEVETKQAELQQLQEEKQRKENDLQTVKEELERIQTTRRSFYFFWGPRKEAEKEAEMEALKTKLETQEMELDTKIMEIEDKQAEVQQLQDQIKRTETREFERSRVAPVQPSSSLFKWMIVSMQTFQDEQQRREEAENRVQTLEEELKEEKQRRENNKKQLKKELAFKTKQVKSLTAEVQKLKEEKQKSEKELKNLLETRIKE